MIVSSGEDSLLVSCRAPAAGGEAACRRRGDEIGAVTALAAMSIGGEHVYLQ